MDDLKKGVNDNEARETSSGGPAGDKTSAAKAEEEALLKRIDDLKKQKDGLETVVKTLESSKVEAKEKRRIYEAQNVELEKAQEDLKKDDPLYELKVANTKRIFASLYKKFPQLDPAKDAEDAEWSRVKALMPKLDPLDVEGSVEKASMVLRGVYFDQAAEEERRKGRKEAQKDELEADTSDIGDTGRAPSEIKPATAKLTDEEKKIAKRMGISEEDYAKQKDNTVWS